MATLSKSLETYTFDYLLNLALDQVSDSVDKRQGSIIYDAISPACYVLAEVFLELKGIVDETFPATATGENLELKVSERGIIRNPATKAIKHAVMIDASGVALKGVPIGTRFSSVGDTPVVYRVSNELVTAGEYQVECEQTGTVGNSYIGTLIPISYIPNLGSATIDTIVIPGEDEETDEQLRARYVEEVNEVAFAGNIAAYDKIVKDISGVGEAQIYPVWDGGGTVLISVVDSTFAPASNAFCDLIENLLDPENSIGVKGTGLGVAPIGHIVTVVAPTVYVVNVSADVSLAAGVTLPQVQSAIEDQVRGYISGVANAWGVPDDYNRYSASVFTAQIAAAILRVNGVSNVTNTRSNGTASDKVLPQTAAVQQLPVIGTVILHVV